MEAELLRQSMRRARFARAEPVKPVFITKPTPPPNMVTIPRAEYFGLLRKVEGLESEIKHLQKELEQPKKPAAVPGEAARVTVSSIQRLICREFDLTMPQLLGDGKDAPTANARMLAAYLCVRMTSRSLAEIGRLFKRDHTTIMHAKQTIANRRKDDPLLNEKVIELEAKLTTKIDDAIQSQIDEHSGVAFKLQGDRNGLDGI